MKLDLLSNRYLYQKNIKFYHNIMAKKFGILLKNAYIHASFNWLFIDHFSFILMATLKWLREFSNNKLLTVEEA